MNLFKGALYLVEAGTEPGPLGKGFEQEFGSAAATRLWLQAALSLDAVDPALTTRATAPAGATEESALGCSG